MKVHRDCIRVLYDSLNTYRARRRTTPYTCVLT